MIHKAQNDNTCTCVRKWLICMFSRTWELGKMQESKTKTISKNYLIMLIQVMKEIEISTCLAR